ncbi:hypothetical protein SAMN02982927_03456 [Sporolactobacillus nakayamae]|uniref:Uncharacterized protein n=1 Tax=Sporolactobacillus nakayamae TaxID=269670 RepID=A0A1I2WCF9_9BACL|nr:hypothetical protein SAMN02982927_03456 [Sporolactobacillus nakayamae]
MAKPGSGIIKKILKDHFDGFWKIYSDLFPESYREDIRKQFSEKKSPVI